MDNALPAIPAKRYFTIGEVSDLCGVKPYVLRYWEQEFTQLKPMKRRGNRRYYQHHEVLLIRRIRGLLYDQGFTISGARNQLGDAGGLGATAAGRTAMHLPEIDDEGYAQAASDEAIEAFDHLAQATDISNTFAPIKPMPQAGLGTSAALSTRSQRASSAALPPGPWSLAQIREELFAIREDLLS
ncbi:MerR family transcriptional regulator [Roseateles koreensis]|uniref:MerR family transcriptional regulator n=1 Tax=Roseateles koreensis TaxID=2987526 RepID=A0ABT5KNP1_9BURK|nr:MerR family transcriptional regulator [Roseateles koreensis]MDC8783983.1 MerR family transcriptional regulator [Roseateles koreensis]